MAPELMQPPTGKTDRIEVTHQGSLLLDCRRKGEAHPCKGRGVTPGCTLAGH